MGEQAGEVATPEIRQQLAVRRNKHVCAGSAIAEGLMEMPAGRDNIRDPRTAHERRMIAGAPADLLHGRTKLHHEVGWVETDGRGEGKLALARPKLDFDRAQRQAQREDITPYYVDDRLDQIVALFREILISGRNELDSRRLARLTRLREADAILHELEDMALDFEPGHEVIAALAEF